MDFEQLDRGSLIEHIRMQDGLLRIDDSVLTELTEEAFTRISFTFTREHLEDLIRLSRDSSSSHNDRLVLAALLRNSQIASGGQFPVCQDTGIAAVYAWKDSGVLTGTAESAALSRGVELAWQKRTLRYSTTVPDSFYEEHDPQTNLPAQILIQTPAGAIASAVTASAVTADAGAASAGATSANNGPAYRLLFCAKGGGSANKTSFFQLTKASLEKEAFIRFLREQIAALGASACPPYTIAVVAGGLSPEQNLLALKLATTGYFDHEIPGWDYTVFGVKPLRDAALEKEVLLLAREAGTGAQFGGTALAAAARVFRLPRHGASFPVSIGVSCSAHRNLLAVIDSEGIHIQKTENHPETIPGFLEAAAYGQSATDRIPIDLNADPASVREKLGQLPTGTALSLSGTVLVARDAAHARWHALLAAGKSLPDYLKDHPIMYAGPAKTPEGKVIGSFGPTTAGRMDNYADELMQAGASLITIAKGNRSQRWRDACLRFGGVYLGTIGGAAALIASENIVSTTILDYPELGMEAVRLVEVRDLPAFVIINAAGEDFYLRKTE